MMALIFSSVFYGASIVWDKKVDFLKWNKKDASLREIAVLRRYHVQDREDYQKYNRLVGQVQKLIAKLKTLKSSDGFRIA